MSNSVDPDETAHSAVSSGSMLLKKKLLLSSVAVKELRPIVLLCFHFLRGVLLRRSTCANDYYNTMENLLSQLPKHRKLYSIQLFYKKKETSIFL